MFWGSESEGLLRFCLNFSRGLTKALRDWISATCGLTALSLTALPAAIRSIIPFSKACSHFWAYTERSCCFWNNLSSLCHLTNPNSFCRSWEKLLVQRFPCLQLVLSIKILLSYVCSYCLLFAKRGTFSTDCQYFITIFCLDLNR